MGLAEEYRNGRRRCQRQPDLRVVSSAPAASAIGNERIGPAALFSYAHKGFTASIEVTS
jgi:hypothetical protein